MKRMRYTFKKLNQDSFESRAMLNCVSHNGAVPFSIFYENRNIACVPIHFVNQDISEVACMVDTQDIMCMEFFRLGLSMGLLLMKEAVDNPYLRREKE